MLPASAGLPITVLLGSGAAGDLIQTLELPGSISMGTSIFPSSFF